jgi:hypothetical protein
MREEALTAYRLPVEGGDGVLPWPRLPLHPYMPPASSGLDSNKVERSPPLQKSGALLAQLFGYVWHNVEIFTSSSNASSRKIVGGGVFDEHFPPLAQ